MMFHAEYERAMRRALIPGSWFADYRRVRIARNLYRRSPRFRELWDEVKGRKPALHHAGWLALWKNV